MPDWETLFASAEMQQLAPTPQLLESIPQLRAAGCRRVLDAGCGVGRHVRPLLETGFAVWAVDLARSGLGILRRRLEGGELDRTLVLCCDLWSLPFRARSFDAVISVNVINHGDTAAFQGYIAEIDRVLRPGGFVFIYVSPYEFGQLVLLPETRELEPGTYVHIATPDGDLVHHFPRLEELRDQFLGYRVRRLEIIQAPIPFMNGVLMPQLVFLGQKGFIIR